MSEKTIAITGAGGFIGKYLLDELSADSSVKVKALTRKETAGYADTDRLRWVSADYSEAGLCEILSGVDTVVHMAGTKGNKTELSDFDSDLEMTENILKAMGCCGVGKIIYASSRLVYGNPETVPWKEEYTPDPRMAYAVNKVRCEELCRRYSSQYGFSADVIRIAQVLGKGEGTRTMINVFQDLAAAGSSLKVIGKSVAKRQYVYAGDVARVIHILAAGSEDSAAERPGFSIINVGMERGYTNLEIAEMINRAFQNEAPIIYDDTNPETITDSIMDITVLKEKTGLTPLDMEQALKMMNSH